MTKLPSEVPNTAATWGGRYECTDISPLLLEACAITRRTLGYWCNGRNDLLRQPSFVGPLNNRLHFELFHTGRLQLGSLVMFRSEPGFLVIRQAEGATIQEDGTLLTQAGRETVRRLYTEDYVSGRVTGVILRGLPTPESVEAYYRDQKRKLYAEIISPVLLVESAEHYRSGQHNNGRPVTHDLAAGLAGIVLEYSAQGYVASELPEITAE